MAKYDSLPNVLVDIGMTSRVAYIQPVGLDGLATTSASIKSDIESIVGGTVYFLAGTYTIDATIAPNSNTKIIGLGDVQLGWGGAVDGDMFYNAALPENVEFENIHFINATNYFDIIVNGTGWRFINCCSDYASARIYVSGNKASFIDCEINYTFQILNAVGVHLINCYFLRYGYFTFTVYSTYTDDKECVFTDCRFIGSDIRSIHFYRADAGAVIKNVKFNHCLFEPYNNTKHIIEVSDNADITVEDISFNNCTFRDALDAYYIPANPIVARWQFTGNIYESTVGTIYNFLGTPLGFIKTNDGGYD